LAVEKTRRGRYYLSLYAAMARLSSSSLYHVIKKAELILKKERERGENPAGRPSFQFISNPKLQDDEFTTYRFIVISCTKSHMIFPKRNSNSELLLARYAEIA
jgi:hypothetical protein